MVILIHPKWFIKYSKQGFIQKFRFGVEVGIAVSHTMPPQLTIDINYVFLSVTKVLMHVVFTYCSNDYQCLLASLIKGEY